MQGAQQGFDLIGMAFGPVGLGQHVVNDIQTAGFHQRQGFIQQALFA
jgi:hypothetical protein